MTSLGYRFAEDFYWFNPAKLPSPIEWVNIRKMRAKDSVNTVWWFSKTDWPKADVTRVLTPYSARMKNCWPTPTPSTTRPPPVRPRHFNSRGFGNGNPVAPGIPSNLLQIPNTDSPGAPGHYVRTMKEVGEETHPARFPADLPKFFIEFLTDPGDPVVDIFSGSKTSGRVAEELGRRWLSIEIDRKYARLSAVRLLEGESVATIHETLAALDRDEVVRFGGSAQPQAARVRAGRGPLITKRRVKASSGQTKLF